MGYPHDRHIKFTDPVHILDVGGLHEGVDARVVGQFTSGEGGDAPIDDALGRFQAVAQALVHFLLPAGEGQGPFFLQGGHPLGGMAPLKGARSVSDVRHGGRGAVGGRSPGLLSLRATDGACLIAGPFGASLSDQSSSPAGCPARLDRNPRNSYPPSDALAPGLG